MLLCGSFYCYFPSVSFSFLTESLNSGSPASPASEKICQPQSQELRPDRFQVCPGGVSSSSEPDSTTDALTLLADLALGSGGDKTQTNHRPPLKNNPSSKGRRPAKADLPLRSPAPKGLVVGGEFVSVISQEHSYSGPGGMQGFRGFVETSPLSDPQDPLECTDPLGQENTNNPKATSQSPSNMPPPCPVAGRRGSERTRSVVRVGEKICVTRQWKDKYEFGQDSKYTNEPLVKSVMRALHGWVHLSSIITYSLLHIKP